MKYLFLLCLLLVACTADEAPTKPVPPPKEFEMDVYDNGFHPDKLILRQGDRVRITFTSNEGPHNVTQQEFGMRVELKDGETSTGTFTVLAPGNYTIDCVDGCVGKVSARIVVNT
ncbi:MAG: cupredoxin domain-containing protein [Candidatus Woesearchaeota archaeon]|nr:cupredoxin domain-containing protein [Candidatus Woesearchaeota archaeon]